VLASRAGIARQKAHALHALHRGVFDGYRTLLGDADFAGLLRQSGGVVLARGEQPGKDELFANLIRDELGIGCETLGPERLRELFPGIATFAKRGLLFPNNGYTLSPHRLVDALFGRFVARGGSLRHERVLKLIRSPDGWQLLTSKANVTARTVIVCAGAWSRSLLDPLGVRIPLETEGGYHLQLGPPSIPIALPIIHRARSLAITPMAEGLRLAGTVEIAGLNAPPDETRAKVLRRHLDELFPGMQAETRRLWMGFRPSLPDSVAAIGPAARHPGLFVAVGHGNDGMIGAPSTGRLIAEMAAGNVLHLPPAPYGLGRFGC
jgi:glycine/D-amino acid oxidase-like deaminating enzyme